MGNLVVWLALILTFSPWEKEQILHVSMLSVKWPANSATGFQRDGE
jgi:hypothetical protein